jgi:hypothetical protein
MLIDALDKNNETFDDIVSNTMTDEEMDVEFDYCYGLTHGISFTTWTGNNVYFPACYDGLEWVASVPRNPNGVPTDHIGGG